MKISFKEKITCFLNSLCDELRACIDHRNNKPKTPKLHKIGSLAIIFCIVVYVLIGCFGAIRSTAEEVSSDTMLIEAGTYRWNDVLTTPSNNFNVSLPFTTIYYNFDEPESEADIPNVVVYQDGISSYLGLTYSKADNADYYSFGFKVTSNSSDVAYLFPPGDDFVGWWGDYLYSNLISLGCSPSNVENSKLINKVISVTADTYVPADFGLWANENWQRVDGQDEVNDVPAGLYFLQNTYNDLRGIINFSVPFLSKSSYFSSIEFVGVEDDQYVSINYVDSQDNITDVFYASEGWQDAEYSVILIQSDTNLSADEYEIFSSAFVSFADNPDLQTLFSAGQLNGQSFGYSQGYSAGESAGYQNGFVNGQAEGMSQGFMSNFFGSIVQALDALKLFGEFSVLNIIEGVLGLLLALWILKLIAGG